MPALEKLNRNRGAVVWDLPDDVRDRTDRYGERKTNAPEEYCVGFEETERDIQRPNGTVITITGVMTTSCDFKVGALVWIAPEKDNPLDQWYESGSAGEETNLYEIVSIDRGRDLKGRVTRREYNLSRFQDQLPEQVT